MEYQKKAASEAPAGIGANSWKKTQMKHHALLRQVGSLTEKWHFHVL
jgi:hypothetical protein